MSIKVKTPKNFLKRLRRQFPKAIKDGETKAALEIERNLKARVKGGTTAEGGGFSPYKSKKYARHKEATGRTDRFVYDGKMLDNIAWARTAKGIKFWFPDAKQRTKAYHNHYTYNRPFFKLSKKEANIYPKRVKQAIEKLLT